MDNPAHPDPSQELPSPPEEKLLRPPTFGEKYGKYRWAIITSLIILISGGIYIATNNTQTPSQANPTISQPPPTSPPAPTPTDNPTTNWKTYTNPELGIKFDYENGIFVSPEKNKVCLTNDLYTPTLAPTRFCKAGQFVEIFTKKPTQSLKDAIQEQFLSNYSSKNCFVEDIPLQGVEAKKSEDKEYAQISFPLSNESVDPWINAEKCPPVYSMTNGLNFFMMDKNVPDKYAFFFIGQYTIIGSDNKPWQDTFKFTK